MEQKSKLSAVMFTDIVGYSRIMEDNEQEALKLLDRHNSIIFPLTAKFDGRVVKSIGDALLIDFDSALSAASCALEIQQTMAEQNVHYQGDNLKLRIGIHLGDVWIKDNDIFGEGVNIAARLEPLASPGGICISRDIYNQVANKMDARFTSLGPKSLKNIKKSVEVYRLSTGVEEEVKLPQRDHSETDAEKESQTLQEKVHQHDSIEDPGERVKKKILTMLDTVMDKAVQEWNNVPQEKKDKIIRKIEEKEWISERKDKSGRHHMSINISNEHKKEEKKEKKTSEKIATGLAMTVAFGAAVYFTGIWWLMFPLIFAGFVPTVVGITELLSKRRKPVLAPPPQKAPGDAQLEEKEILQLASRLKGQVTILQTAKETSLSIDQAKVHLDRMVTEGYASLNIQDSGVLLYEFDEFKDQNLLE